MIRMEEKIQEAARLAIEFSERIESVRVLEPRDFPISIFEIALNKKIELIREKIRETALRDCRVVIPESKQESTAEEHANECVNMTYACALSVALAMVGHLVNPMNIKLQFIMKEFVPS